jgi:hypothetical protein
VITLTPHQVALALSAQANYLIQHEGSASAAMACSHGMASASIRA